MSGGVFFNHPDGLMVLDEQSSVPKKVWDSLTERKMTAAQIKVKFWINVPAALPQDTFVIQAPKGVMQIDVGAALFPKPRNRHEKRKMAKTGER